MRAYSPACSERDLGCEHLQPTPPQENNVATLRRGITALPPQQLQGLNKPIIYRINGEPPQALAPISHPLPHIMPTTTLSNGNVLLSDSKCWSNHDQYRTGYTNSGTNSGTQTQLLPSGPTPPSPPRGRLNQGPPSRPSAPTPDSMRLGRNAFSLSGQSGHTHPQGQGSVSSPPPSSLFFFFFFPLLLLFHFCAWPGLSSWCTCFFSDGRIYFSKHQPRH